MAGKSNLSNVSLIEAGYEMHLPLGNIGSEKQNKRPLTTSSRSMINSMKDNSVHTISMSHINSSINIEGKVNSNNQINSNNTLNAI